MRRAALLTATAVLLLTPTVLAFFSGGYFDKPRLIATLVVWAVVLVVAVAGPGPLPGSTPGRVAIAGLGLITVWSGVSVAWAPLSDPATDSLVRLLLYVGALLAAASLLRMSLAARAVEPALGLGALIVIGYGLSERLLPGVIDLAESRKAFGRLEQPITYWNAEGALAAMGLVLCARLAGADDRPTGVRVAAAAAAIPLGLKKTAADDLVMRVLKVFKMDENGNPVAYEADGRTARFGSSGERLTIEEFVKNGATDKEQGFAHLFADSGGAGGDPTKRGSRDGGGGDDGGYNPWINDASKGIIPNRTEQNKIIKSDPDLAERMAKRAGVDLKIGEATRAGVKAGM